MIGIYTIYTEGKPKQTIAELINEQRAVETNTRIAIRNSCTFNEIMETPYLRAAMGWD